MHAPSLSTPPSPARAASPRLPGLEVLRFAAAMWVLVLHVRANFGGPPWLGRGYLGVDFFLMLSGFLMARIQEPRLAAGASPWAFLRARYWRMWPTMAVGGALGLPMAWHKAAGLADFLELVVPNLLLVPVWWGPFVFALNIPAWTVFFELAMNALHVTLLRRLNRAVLWGGLALMAPALACVAQSVGARLGHGTGTFDLGARPDSFWAGALRILFAYGLGIALSRWWAGRSGAAFWRNALLVLAAGAALYGLALAYAGLALHQRFSADGWRLDMLFVTLICPQLLLAALYQRRFARVSGWLGKLAFPLFAVQMPILQGLRYAHGNGWVAGGLCVVAGVVVGWGRQWWQLARANVMRM